jgi:hypothetical protein
LDDELLLDFNDELDEIELMLEMIELACDEYVELVEAELLETELDEAVEDIDELFDEMPELDEFDDEELVKELELLMLELPELSDELFEESEDDKLLCIFAELDDDEIAGVVLSLPLFEESCKEQFADKNIKIRIMGTIILLN